LLVHGGQTSLVLRSLRAVELDGGWCVPVMGDVGAMQAAGLTTPTTLVEFPTDAGPVRLDAELVQADDTFVLRAPGLRTAAMIEQRRENVRGLVQLPFRGTVLAAASTRSQVPDSTGVDLEGITQTVSGGGISADLDGTLSVTPGSRIYVELGMPGGDLAPAVMTVVEHAGPRVRARFTDISPLDRERLVRLVFARQRAELAERRRAEDAQG
jgi:hypothetical protein